MYKIVFLIIGVISAFPASYFFQPEYFQRKVSLERYLGNLDKFQTDGNYMEVVYITVFSFAVIGLIIGHLIDNSKNKSKL